MLTKFLFGFTMLWLGFLAVTFAVITLMIARDSNFPLGLGWIHTQGRAGLIVTVSALAICVVAILLLLMQRQLGAWLVFGFSAFWAADFLFATAVLLPTIIRHPIVSCRSGTCDSVPFAMFVTVCFALCLCWSAPRVISNVSAKTAQ